MRYPDWFKKLFKKEVDLCNEEVIFGSDMPPPEELKSFKRNPIWKYISDTIDYRIKSARDDLENQNLDLDTFRVFQGRIEELRFIGSLPDFLIENYDQLKAEVKAKKEAEKEEPTKQEESSWQKKE